MIIPVIIRATGSATKGLKENLESMLGKYSRDSLQKTALFRTSYIKRNELQSETGSLSGGGSPLFQEKYQEEKARNKRKQRHNNNNNNNNNKFDI